MDNDLKRMIKIEDRMMQIAEEMGLETVPIEFDIVPPQKMLEIMSYRIPTNVSNWKYGRDYERLRTIHENINAGLPYEVVINSDPSRAYLMRSNVFAVQILVMAHVIGHVAFFTMNKFFKETRKDIVEFLSEAAKRINKYEKSYGIDAVETIIDAGHALQLHSSPFETETEDEKRERIFKQLKQKLFTPTTSDYGDLSGIGIPKVNINEDIELHNQKLWRSLMLKTPVEPTEDILRYVVDNSNILEDWQKDILEILRIEGQYFWPQMKTRFMNEGFATYIHQQIMDKLFKEGILTISDHAQYNYSNSLVKAMNPSNMNPYHIGCGMYEDIVERWDKGRHGRDWEDCTDLKVKEDWDTKEMKGNEKIFEVMRSYTDWFFMQDFLTPDLVKKLKLYIYATQETPITYDYVITRHDANEIRKLIVNSFAHSGIPKIEVINGNHQNQGDIKLLHKHSGLDLDKKYTEETMKHLYKVWGRPVHLDTIQNNTKVSYTIKTSEKVTSTKGKTGKKKADVWTASNLIQDLSTI